VTNPDLPGDGVEIIVEDPTTAEQHGFTGVTEDDATAAAERFFGVDDIDETDHA
jgi:hypothetical protein